MNSLLVSCFSAGGRTAAVAEALSSRLAADSFRILPQEPYTAADLNWMDRRSRTSLEMSDESCRPLLRGLLPDFSSYSLMLLGFPIWWHKEPRIIDTFLESADFSGMEILPFATSAGSEMVSAEQRLYRISPEAIWRPGFLVNNDEELSRLLELLTFDSLHAAAL